MTSELEEIRKRWIRLRVCNICSKNFQRQQGNEETQEKSSFILIARRCFGLLSVGSSEYPDHSDAVLFLFLSSVIFWSTLGALSATNCLAIIAVRKRGQKPNFWYSPRCFGLCIHSFSLPLEKKQ